MSVVNPDHEELNEPMHYSLDLEAQRAEAANGHIGSWISPTAL
jgi:hypothetical protein